MKKYTGRKAVKKKNIKIIELLRTIRKHCTQCMGFQHKDCKMSECPLFKWRPYKYK